MLTNTYQSYFFILGFFITASMLNAGCSDGGPPGLSESLDETVSPIEVIDTFPEYADENIELDVSIQATFSASIDTSSINDSTFIVREGGIEISGTFSYSGSTVTFMPNRTFARNTSINTTITSQVADVEGNTMDQEYEWNFTTRPATTYEATPPTVIETNPKDGATDISANTNISARFSKTLNPETINSNTFYLRNNNGSIIPGSLSYTDSTATFSPSESLPDGVEYTATITNDIEDPFGNSPDQSYNWNFTTKEIDRTPPRVISTNPENHEEDVAFDIQITATFSERIDPATINSNTFRLRTNLNSISGSVSYEDSTAVFKPSSTLQDGIVFTAIITDGIQDLKGNSPPNNYSWNFITKEIDRTPPHIISTKPQNEEDDVPIDIQITATFSEQMSKSTINEDTFELYQWQWGQYRKLSGSVSYSGSTATFTPGTDLRDEQYYTVIISSDVTDLAGNALGATYRWDFETEDD
ncbi:hypothetical protein CK503_06645 [Aliifodinibius salipaludis]|uniref:SbsA Ig-like domain-containing protein n=1 Tax=Fodinibius salipaludis TaxID=2032627 RepID=A0A2A2GCF6_9BACT|nr:Ig-like domain-containing protein [Aliifodinibius salipaludis]PAU94472.1 hypothetical protein CK503_06645 [Aliifodinibius salipaludis]